MKFLIVLFFCAFAALMAASVARTLLSAERAVHDGKVLAFTVPPGNDVRDVPLPGDIAVVLRDGREVHVALETAEPLRPGASVRVSERVAPWGETWYRLAK